MILHPGILALIIGSTCTLLMLCFAAFAGEIIQLKWNHSSSSEYQLILERRTYLISTLTHMALGIQVISTLLFIYVIDDIHLLFTGAMCATGSLNANPIGWYALVTKIFSFFVCGFWIVLNTIDQNSELYPLIKKKYRLLLGLLPLLIIDYVLQLSYFINLSPDIITSCCGSLFSTNTTSTISSISSLDPLVAIIYFSIVSILFLAALIIKLSKDSLLPRYLISGLGVVYFFSAIISIIAFVSPYIYELPTHHCPFDMLQQPYNFIGYPLYLTLFAGTFYALLPGIFAPLHKNPSLREIVKHKERRWLYYSLIYITTFTIIVCFAVSFSSLNYFV